MGEVATALVAFDDAFARCLGALRGPDASSSSSHATWPTHQRACVLVADLKRDVPPDVFASKATDAGELALSRGQWGVARHACFEHVLALGLVSQGAETDPRWNPGTNDSRRDDVDLNGVQSRRSQTCDASFTKLVRVTLHLRAAIGKARCDAREVWEGDLEVRRPQSLLLLQQACVGATEVMQHGSAGDESLYWLVKNATRVVKDAATLLIDSGNAFVALPSLVFSIRALESHALLATPAHLEWRLGLVKMTIACFDDVSPLTAVGEKSYAAGTTFLQKAKQSIEDLKQLEAMDATPMEPTRKRLYANADRLVMVMEASRGDAEKVTAFAEFLNAEVENETVCSYKPGDTNEHQMRSRQLVELLELTSGAYGPATSAVQTAASAWIAKRCDAAFVWYRHAEKVEAYEASKQTSADENTRDEEEDRTEEPEEGDAEGTSAFNSEASSEPPPKLSEAETAAYALTVFEFGDVSTHSALLRFSNAFAESHAFEALVMFGNYLLKEGQVKEGSEAGSKTSMETGLSAEKALRNSRLKQTVELLVALRLAEGRTLVGGDCEDGEKKKGEDEEENGETAEDSKKRTESTPQDHVQRLASAIKGVSPDSAKTSHCAESLLKGGLLLVDFCETKFEENAAGKAQTAYGFDVDEADTQIVTDALESASHAFESLDLRDHTLRASVLLKLSALYEKRGDGVSLRRADECATLASFVLNRARDDFVTEYCVGDPHEATKFLSAEAIWGDDTADKGSGFLKAFTPSTMSETQKRTACLAADAFSLSVKLQLVSSLEKRGVHVGGKKMELLPPDLLDELRTAAGDNHWEQAVVAMEAAACVGRESVAGTFLENAVAFLEKAEKAERVHLENSLAFENTKRKGDRDSPRSPLSGDADAREGTSGVLSRRSAKSSLVPSAPRVLRVTGDSVTVECPDLRNLRSTSTNAKRPKCDQYSVVVVPFGAGFTPGVRNDGYPGSGVLHDVDTADASKNTATVSGLRKNVAYSLAIVAYEKGAVINGVGDATAPVVASHPLPSTTIWARLAQISVQCGCVEIARLASATTRRRFVEISSATTRVDLRDTHTISVPKNPVTCQRIRRDVVEHVCDATLRAAARGLLVSAEVLAATKLPNVGEVSHDFDNIQGDRAPLPELRTPKHREFLVRLDVAKRCLLAMELAVYSGDRLLTQECGLRVGNAVAGILAASRRKPKAAIAALVQTSVLLETCGAARSVALARFAVSVSFELANALRACGERKGLVVAAQALNSASLVAPNGVNNPELLKLQERLLFFPEWRRFSSEVLQTRAAASAGADAGDPVGAVLSALGIDQDGSAGKGPPKASSGFDALKSLPQETVSTHPGPYMRAFGVVVDVLVGEVKQDTGDHCVEKTLQTLADWTADVFGKCDAASKPLTIAFPESTGRDDDYDGTCLEDDVEAAIVSLEGEITTEMRSVFGKGEPAPVGGDELGDEAKAAYAQSVADFQSAKETVDAASKARADASHNAQIRERAARCLTRLAPPMFRRRAALRSSRQICDAHRPWRSKACVAIGRLAWEAGETKFGASADLSAAGPDLYPDNADTPKPAACSLYALTHLARGVELAGRASHYGRVLEAARAMLDLARSPKLGFLADETFAEGGGARVMAVAAGRVLEQLRFLKQGKRAGGLEDGTDKVVGNDYDSALAKDPTRDENFAGYFVEDEKKASASSVSATDSFPGTKNTTAPPDLRTPGIAVVSGGHSRGPLVRATLRTSLLATKKRQKLLPPRSAFPLLKTAFASETFPPIDGGTEAWFCGKPGFRVEFVTRFVTTAIEVCVKAKHHHRASELALGLCDVIDTDRVRLDVLPKVQNSLRLCEEKDNTVQPFLADAVNASLARATANVPEHVLALRAARESFFPETADTAGTANAKLAGTVSTHAKSNMATLCLYDRAVRLASSTGDRVAESQARLEYGDALYASGDVESAVLAWSACLDRVVGRFDVAFDKNLGVSCLPPTPEAALSMFGLKGCLRAAAAAARLATRTVVAPFRVGDASSIAIDDVSSDNALHDSPTGNTTGNTDQTSQTQPLLGIGQRIAVAEVSARLYEAAYRAGFGDDRFFGGDFYEGGGCSSLLSSSSFLETGSDVSWEGLGDSIVTGWDSGYTFDINGVFNDVSQICEVLLNSPGRATSAGVCASLGEALASRRLRCVKKTVDCKVKRVCCLVELGALGPAASLLIEVMEGTNVPSIAGGEGGRSLALTPDRGDDEPADGGAKGDSGDTFPETGPPRFVDSEPLWSKGNQRVTKYVSSCEIAPSTRTVYGEQLTHVVELARARWLVAVAAAAAPIATGADADRDEVFFPSKTSSSGDASGDTTNAPDSTESTSTEPVGRDECLANAKKTLLSVIDEVEIEIAAVAETGQAEVDASISKIDNEETRNKTKRDARELSVKEKKERIDNKNAKKAFDGDWSDTEEQADKENETEGTEKEDTRGDGEDDEGETDNQSCQPKPRRPERCHGEGVSPWILSSPERLKVLLDAHLMLARCLSKQRDISGALKIAKHAADVADAMACASPAGCVVGGDRARFAAIVAARVGAGKRIALRVFFVSTLFTAGAPHDEVLLEAAEASRTAEAFGDVDAVRRLRFVVAQAEAVKGNVLVAETKLQSLLVDTSGGYSVGSSPKASPAFHAAVAQRLAKLLARRGDPQGAATSLTAAVAECRAVAIANGGFGVHGLTLPRREGNGCVTPKPELVHAHALSSVNFVSTALAWCQYTLASRGSASSDRAKLNDATRVLTEARVLTKHSATVSTSLQSKVELLFGFCLSRLAFESLESRRSRGTRKNELLLSESYPQNNHVSVIAEATKSLRVAGRLAHSAAAGHDLRVMRCAALELCSALMVENAMTNDSIPDAEGTRLVTVLNDGRETAHDRRFFVDKLKQCLRDSSTLTEIDGLLTDVTNRAELTEGLGTGEAFGPKIVEFVDAEEKCRASENTLASDPDGDKTASLSRRVFATRARLASVNAAEVSDVSSDTYTAGCASNEALAFLGDTHLAALKSQTYCEKFCVVKTPKCFVEPKDGTETTEDADAGADADAENSADANDSADASTNGTAIVLAQWRTPISCPPSWRTDRGTKHKTPATLSFFVRTRADASSGSSKHAAAGGVRDGEETKDANDEAEEKLSAVSQNNTPVCVFGEVYIDIGAVRGAQRTVRDARIALRDVLTVAADGEDADGEEGDTSAAADDKKNLTGEAKKQAMAKAFESFRLVVTLFAPITTGSDAALTTNSAETKTAITFPTEKNVTVSFLENLERFCSPELGVAVDDADADALADFITQVLMQT